MSCGRELLTHIRQEPDLRPEKPAELTKLPGFFRGGLANLNLRAAVTAWDERLPLEASARPLPALVGASC